MGCSISIEVGKGKKDNKLFADTEKVHLGMPAGKLSQGSGDWIERFRASSKALQRVAEQKLLFDAHCHYLDFLQKTEGLAKLASSMDKVGVGYAALTGCPFKKTWVGAEQAAPVHPLYDDGDLYPYSNTDGILVNDVRAAAAAHGFDFISRFGVMACGFNLGDFGLAAEVERELEVYPCMGIGELVLQSDDINNMTIKGGNWTSYLPAVTQVLEVCAKKSHFPAKPLAFVFTSDARSISTKPYRTDFEYMYQVEEVLDKCPNVKCLWVAAGIFPRGQWKDYSQILEAMLKKHPNLYLSFTPLLVAGKLSGLPRAEALSMAAKYHTRICVGTTVRGLFSKKPPAEFGEMSYEEEVQSLQSFVADLEKQSGAAAAAWVRYRTAATVFGHELPEDKDATAGSAVAPSRLDSGGEDVVKAAVRRVSMIADTPQRRSSKQLAFMADLAYGGTTGETIEPMETIIETYCPPSKQTKWKTIDCHLHLLDFLQKSSGTAAALKAMDGCEVERAVIFGMPCCKKWCYYRPVQPLYYQDDNGPCYVYAYADQMVADAWLALSDEHRQRFAPCFASFDPTDRAAISHVKRMYYKYPKMWRGLGEVMCRHDDLTNMLLSKEIPRINHIALMDIYKFCAEVNLPVLVHHNADRVGDNDLSFSYKHEVEEVLRDPALAKMRMVWVHAGVSRRCSEPNHHEMIDQMLSDYPNLKIDISWVVWEDVICDEAGKIKPQWVECIQKHHTRFYIGSDNVAQYFPVNDTSVNLLAMNITKYWPLFDLLTKEAAENVSYMNAYRDYFESWDIPKGNGSETRYLRIEPVHQTECLDPETGNFVSGATELETNVDKY